MSPPKGSRAVTVPPAVLPPAPAVADFFLCDIAGAIPKDDMATMEHPVFSLSTRPDRRVLSYAHNGISVEITPSVKGLATIHDKDVLIYCISQLVAALNAGRPTARRLELVAHDLLTATGRETSGDSYRRLREAFERLAGTRIVTNIPTGETTVTTGFGLIEEWQIVRRTRSGRMVSVSVTLSDWLYRAVVARSVLTLSREYFGLRKPLGAAALRTGAQALRTAGALAGLDAGALRQVGLGLAAQGVPQDGARHRRGRPAAGLCPQRRGRRSGRGGAAGFGHRGRDGAAARRRRDRRGTGGRTRLGRLRARSRLAALLGGDRPAPAQKPRPRPSWPIARNAHRSGNATGRGRAPALFRARNSEEHPENTPVERFQRRTGGAQTCPETLRRPHPCASPPRSTRPWASERGQVHAARVHHRLGRVHRLSPLPAPARGGLDGRGL